MKARYAGWCKVCRERIAPGEDIESAKGEDGWAHAVCPATQGRSATRSPQLHPARRGFTGGRRHGHTRGIHKIS